MYKVYVQQCRRTKSIIAATKRSYVLGQTKSTSSSPSISTRESKIKKKTHRKKSLDILGSCESILSSLIKKGAKKFKLFENQKHK